MPKGSKSKGVAAYANKDSGYTTDMCPAWKKNLPSGLEMGEPTGAKATSIPPAGKVSKKSTGSMRDY